MDNADADRVLPLSPCFVAVSFELKILARFYRMVGAIEAGSRDTVENFKRFSLEAAKV